MPLLSLPSSQAQTSFVVTTIAKLVPESQNAGCLAVDTLYPNDMGPVYVSSISTGKIHSLDQASGAVTFHAGDGRVVRAVWALPAPVPPVPSSPLSLSSPCLNQALNHAYLCFLALA